MGSAHPPGSEVIEASVSLAVETIAAASAGQAVS